MSLRDHTCRIVREAAAADQAVWSLYWDGAFRDRYETPRTARAVALSLCSPHRPELVELSVEDSGGRRISTERLRHDPER